MMTPGCSFPPFAAPRLRGRRLAFAVCAALATVALGACGGDSTPQPPAGSGGGSGNNAGGSGGSASGAGGGGTSSAGGSGGGNNAQASVRFCNGVSSASGPVTVELRIGGTKVDAQSGACAPACVMVPAGNAQLSFHMNNAEVFKQDLTFEAGQHYGVIASIDNTTQKIGLGGGKLPAGQQCGSYNPFGSGGKTVGKFCHNLSRGMNSQEAMPVELDLAVGSVPFRATTGGCSSPAMQMCPALPSGKVTATLSYLGQMLATQELTLEAGKAYVFGATADGGLPTITATAVASEMACASAGPATGQPMPMPMPPAPGAKATVKFCNRLTASAGAPNVAELVSQDGVRFMARPGQCAPAKGMPCSKVNAGANTFTLALDGTDVASAMGNLPDREVVISLGLNAAGEPAFTLSSVPAGMMCADYEPM